MGTLLQLHGTVPREPQLILSCHGRKGTSPGRDKDLKSSQPQSGGVSLSQNPPRPHLFEADVSAFSSSAAPHWHHHPPISTLLVHHTNTPAVANVRASAVYSQLSPSRSIHALSIPFSRIPPAMGKVGVHGLKDLRADGEFRFYTHFPTLLHSPIFLLHTTNSQTSCHNNISRL
jgi:hypothetical protein